MASEDQSGDSLNAGKWKGVCDGEPWELEVEPDAFGAVEGLGVAIWTENPKTLSERETGLAFLTPDVAREVAAVLVACADYVEKARAAA